MLGSPGAHLLRGPAIFGHAQLDADDLDLRPGGAATTIRCMLGARPAGTQPEHGRAEAGQLLQHKLAAPPPSYPTQQLQQLLSIKSHVPPSRRPLAISCSPAPQWPRRSMQQPGHQTPLAAMPATRLFPACTAVSGSSSEAGARVPTAVEQRQAGGSHPLGPGAPANVCNRSRRPDAKHRRSREQPGLKALVEQALAGPPPPRCPLSLIPHAPPVR